MYPQQIISDVTIASSVTSQWRCVLLRSRLYWMQSSSETASKTNLAAFVATKGWFLVFMVNKSLVHAVASVIVDCSQKTRVNCSYFVFKQLCFRVMWTVESLANCDVVQIVRNKWQISVPGVLLHAIISLSVTFLKLIGLELIQSRSIRTFRLYGDVGLV